MIGCYRLLLYLKMFFFMNEQSSSIILSVFSFLSHSLGPPNLQQFWHLHIHFFKAN